METKKLMKPDNINITSTAGSILLSQECHKTLNNRIKQEELSSRLYLAMSLYLNNEGYTGAAKLWMKYSEEEMNHANWSRNYLLSLGIQPEVPSLEAPRQSFSGLPQIISLSYEHEIEITKQCKDLGSYAMKNSDHLLYTLAAKYLTEQVEELDKMQTWVDKIKTFGISPPNLKLLDEEMGE